MDNHKSEKNADDNIAIADAGNAVADDKIVVADNGSAFADDVSKLPKGGENGEYRDGGNRRPWKEGNGKFTKEACSSSSKHALRDKVWSDMEDKQPFKSLKSSHKKIPYFKECEKAVERLKQLKEFIWAENLKVCTSRTLEHARYLTLQASKKLYVSTSQANSCLLKAIIQPDHARPSFIRYCSTSKGMYEYGEPIALKDQPKIDLVVIGSVFVSKNGFRIGKGDGLTDLEFAMMLTAGIITRHTPVVTIVDECQIGHISRDIIKNHDITVNYILTPKRIIACQNRSNTNISGVNWSIVPKSKFLKIPVLMTVLDMEIEQKIKVLPGTNGTRDHVDIGTDSTQDSDRRKSANNSKYKHVDIYHDGVNGKGKKLIQNKEISRKMDMIIKIKNNEDNNSNKSNDDNFETQKSTQENGENVSRKRGQENGEPVSIIGVKIENHLNAITEQHASCCSSNVGEESSGSLVNSFTKSLNISDNPRIENESSMFTCSFCHKVSLDTVMVENFNKLSLGSPWTDSIERLHVCRMCLEFSKMSVNDQRSKACAAFFCNYNTHQLHTNESSWNWQLKTSRRDDSFRLSPFNSQDVDLRENNRLPCAKALSQAIKAQTNEAVLRENDMFVDYYTEFPTPDDHNDRELRLVEACYTTSNKEPERSPEKQDIIPKIKYYNPPAVGGKPVTKIPHKREEKATLFDFLDPETKRMKIDGSEKDRKDVIESANYVCDTSGFSPDLISVNVTGVTRLISISQFKRLIREKGVNPVQCVWRNSKGRVTLLFKYMYLAEGAVEKLQGLDVKGHPVKVELAKRFTVNKKQS